MGNINWQSTALGQEEANIIPSVNPPSRQIWYNDETQQPVTKDDEKTEKETKRHFSTASPEKARTPIPLFRPRSRYIITGPNDWLGILQFVAATYRVSLSLFLTSSTSSFLSASPPIEASTLQLPEPSRSPPSHPLGVSHPVPNAQHPYPQRARCAMRDACVVVIEYQIGLAGKLLTPAPPPPPPPTLKSPLPVLLSA